MSDEELFEQRRLARQEKARRDDALLQLHVMAADALSDPSSRRASQVRGEALSWINTWEEKKLCSPYYIAEWRRMLSLPPAEMRQAMLRAHVEGIALRQNTPFGFLKSSGR
jgi:hypothetical protein